MIDFGNSEYILYIISVSLMVLIVFLIYAFWRRRGAALIFGSSFKTNILVRGNYRRIFLKEILVVLAVILAALSLMRPMWGETVREVTYEGTDLLVALDVSSSMKARDVSSDRLTRGKDAVRRIAESLKGDRIGLIVFAGEAFLLSPLTSDIGSFLMFLDAADTDSVRSQGTDFPALLKEGERVFSRKRLTAKMMVVITDGENHEDGIEGSLEFYRRNGISIYTIAVGGSGDYIPVKSGASSESLMKDREGSLVRTIPDKDFLKSISSSTGGAFTDISSSFTGLRAVYDEISGQQKQVSGEGIVKEKKDRTWIFLLLFMLVLSLELMLNENKRLKK